ncbi:MAG: glutamate racemase [Candidatus Omnitrophota bacterium]
MKLLQDRPIGIFDSGVGGLTVARSIRRYLPAEDIIYFGDTARVPYGNKSRNTIIRFSREIMDFLMKDNVKAVVVACNTASSLSLSSLKLIYPVPVIGVIKPGLKEAISILQAKRIGVIGTNSTIESLAYEKEARRIDPAVRIFSKSCPLFVPLVENRFVNDEITELVAEKYLKNFKNKKLDALILGCTHYPILKTVIKRVLNNVQLIDSSYAVAREIEKVLREKKIASDTGKKNGSMKCFVSDDAEGFRKTAGIFLKQRIKVKKVNL